MTPDAIEALLDAWGEAGRARACNAEPRSLTGNSVFARYGRPGKKDGLAEGRCGKERRQAMARAAGGAVVGLRTVPTSYVDPVPCTATRSYRAPDYDPRETKDVEFVQTAWLAMYRTNALQANVLRVEYQENGRQADKAPRLTDEAGHPLKLRRYRDELRMAKVWLAGRLSDKR